MAIIQQGFLRATEDIDILLESSNDKKKKEKKKKEILPNL